MTFKIFSWQSVCQRRLTSKTGQLIQKMKVNKLERICIECVARQKMVEFMCGTCRFIYLVFFQALRQFRLYANENESNLDAMGCEFLGNGEAKVAQSRDASTEFQKSSVCRGKKCSYIVSHTDEFSLWWFFFRIFFISRPLWRHFYCSSIRNVSDVNEKYWIQ